MRDAHFPDKGPAWLRRRQPPEYPETVEILLGGTVVIASIIDISAEGIRLSIPVLTRIPNRTYLKFEDGEVFPTECLWKRSGEAHFRFALEHVVAEVVSRIPDDECNVLISMIDSAMQQD